MPGTRTWSTATGERAQRPLGPPQTFNAVDFPTMARQSSRNVYRSFEPQQSRTQDRPGRPTYAAVTENGTYGSTIKALHMHRTCFHDQNTASKYLCTHKTL